MQCFAHHGLRQAYSWNQWIMNAQSLTPRPCHVSCEYLLRVVIDPSWPLSASQWLLSLGGTGFSCADLSSLTVCTPCYVAWWLLNSGTNRSFNQRLIIGSCYHCLAVMFSSLHTATLGCSHIKAELSPCLAVCGLECTNMPVFCNAESSRASSGIQVAVCLTKPVMGETLHWSDNWKWRVICWHAWSSKIIILLISPVPTAKANLFMRARCNNQLGLGWPLYTQEDI